MSVLINNCRVVSPNIDWSEASVLIEGDIIKSVLPRPPENVEVESVFDLGGATLMPGFFDIHFHGADGYDFTDRRPEGSAAIAERKLDEGVTTFCSTTLTLPEEQLAESLRQMAKYAANPSAAKLAGVHLEGPFINCDCIGAQNPDYVRAPDIEEIKRLNQILRVLIVSYAPEVENGVEFTKDLVDAGITPSAGHSAATYQVFQDARKHGLKHLTHFCNQMSKLHHREIGLVGSGLLDSDVLVEIIADKIHLCPDMIQLVFKTKPIEQIALITDAMSASWLDDGEFDLGGLKVDVANGAARLKSNGALAGSTLRFNQALKNVCEITELPLKELVKTTSWNQAESLGIKGIGKIEEGFTADLVVLDDDFNVLNVFLNGEKVR